MLAPVVPAWLAVTTGAMLVLFAGFNFVAALWRELGLSRLLPEHDLALLPKSILVVANSFLILVTLAALVGVLAIQAPM